jgi:hypothetical protein
MVLRSAVYPMQCSRPKNIIFLFIHYLQLGRHLVAGMAVRWMEILGVSARKIKEL